MNHVLDSTAVPAAQSVLSFCRNLFPSDSWSQVWLVGGAVRDLLAGRDVRDLDFVSSLKADALRQAGFRYVSCKSSVPIFFRSFPGGTAELVRIESLDELCEDLRRRDFTINSMAFSLCGELIDPCHGRDAIAARQLCICSPDAFAADPLRLVRACRFRAEGWRPDAVTLQKMRSFGQRGELDTIPVERFSRELVKALAAAEPAAFFSSLLDTAAAKHFLPELHQMATVPAGPPDKHPEGDLLSHSLQVLDRIALLSPDPIARFCAMFHDIGKLATEPSNYPRHHGHEQAGSSLAEQFSRRLRLPRAYGRSLRGACRLHGLANRWQELRLGTRLSMAEEAILLGVGGIIPLLASTDKSAGIQLTGWDEFIRIAGLSAVNLGIPTERLVELPPQARQDHIRQIRLQMLRRVLMQELNVNDCAESGCNYETV